MATLMVMPSSPDVDESVTDEHRGLGKRAQVAPAIAGLDEVDAVPMERLLHEQLRAESLVERSGGLVGGDDPRDHGRGAMRNLCCSGGGHKPLTQALTLSLGHDVD